MHNHKSLWRLARGLFSWFIFVIALQSNWDRRGSKISMHSQYKRLANNFEELEAYILTLRVGITLNWATGVSGTKEKSIIATDTIDKSGSSRRYKVRKYLGRQLQRFRQLWGLVNQTSNGTHWYLNRWEKKTTPFTYGNACSTRTQLSQAFNKAAALPDKIISMFVGRLKRGT